MRRNSQPETFYKHYHKCSGLIRGYSFKFYRHPDIPPQSKALLKFHMNGILSVLTTQKGNLGIAETNIYCPLNYFTDNQFQFNP